MIPDHSFLRRYQSMVCSIRVLFPALVRGEGANVEEKGFHLKTLGTLLVNLPQVVYILHYNINKSHRLYIFLLHNFDSAFHTFAPSRLRAFVQGMPCLTVFALLRRSEELFFIASQKKI
jgi:hypothetical protein